MKKLISFILVVLLISLGSAANSLVKTTFYTSNNFTYYDAGTYFSKAVVLEIDTPEKPVTCKYTKDTLKDYYSMEGTFENNFEYTHKITISDLSEGLYKYYIRCINQNASVEPGALQVSFKVENLISGQIILQDDPPLKAGQYEVTLITSESPSQKPVLTYSLDGIVYNPVPLYGSEKNWKGFIVIPNSVGETVGSFKLNLKDLEGRTGEEITRNGVFIVDTKKPAAIGTIEAKGFSGQIKLDWYLEENVDQYQIYRSLEPTLSYTEYYKTSTESAFTDNEVERGKTYYYRVAAVDDAGNVADLSREVYATALLAETSTTATNTGLRLELIGLVDNVLSEISSVKEIIESSKSLVDKKEENEKKLFQSLGLIKEMDSSITELNSIKRDVESYKTQDLAKEELERKLSSASLKINAIKKKTPENIIIENQKTSSRAMTDNKLSELMLEAFVDLTENEKEKSEKYSKKLIESSQYKNSYEAYNLEIIYMDGTRKTVSFIREIFSGEIERMGNTTLVMYIPKTVVEMASEIIFKSGSPEIIKEDPVLGFDSDTKEISYLLNKKIDLSKLEEVIVAPIQKYSEETKNSFITGNAIVSFANNNLSKEAIYSLGILSLIGIFIFLTNNRKMKNEINSIFEEIEDLIKKGKRMEAIERYNKLRDNFKKFSKAEKKLIFSRFGELQKKLGAG